MGKIAVIQHILRLVPGYPGEFPIFRQGLQPILQPDVVHQSDDLGLKAGYRIVELGDAQHLAGVDKVRVADLWVGLNDLAGAHLVFRGDLPHGIAFCNGVGEAGGMGGCQQGPGKGRGQKQSAE